MGRHIGQVADGTPYDNETSGIPATNVRTALDYLVGVSLNFSFKKIADSLELRVRENEQMLVFQSITIDGSLVVDGEVCLI